MKDKIRKKLVENFGSDMSVDMNSQQPTYNENETFELNKQVFDGLVSIAKQIPLSVVAQMSDSQKEIAVINMVEEHFRRNPDLQN